MIIAGYEEFGSSTEIVDLTIEGGNKCNDWPIGPIAYQLLWDASYFLGGLIGNNPIICNTYTTECHIVSKEGVTVAKNMSMRRVSPASIVLSDSKMWISGGYFYDYSLDSDWDQVILVSSEFITKDGSLPGPDIPFPMFGHVIVTINDTCSMTIVAPMPDHYNYYGGYFVIWSPVSPTFYYDHAESEWINGPDLLQGREAFAAGIVTDEVTNENFVAVTGGYVYDTTGWLDDYWGDFNTSEILQDGEWIQGPLLPIPLSGHSMVRLGKGQALLGGTNINYNQESYGLQKKIYLMTCSDRNCIISLFNRQLSAPRTFFVAIPIPDTMTGCSTKGEYDFHLL